MAKGSEQPAWRWTTARECQLCEETLRLKDIARFHYEAGQDSIRCVRCVNARVQAFVKRTREDLGLAP